MKRLRAAWGVGGPPAVVGVVQFWMACSVLVGGFLLPGPLSWIVPLIALEPIIFGTHEAIHGTLVPGARYGSRLAVRHQEFAASLGFALQLMNVCLLKPAHMHHHKFGRYDDGWAPDVTPGRPLVRQRLLYYMNLIILPAVTWQLAGFARLAIRPSRLPFLFDIGFRERIDRRYVLSQIAVVVFVVYAVLAGGWLTFVIYGACLTAIWSLQQNVAHYGLRGIDPKTDRVCAHTYILQWPFNWITYGSTSHFLHHADTRIPGNQLYDLEHLRRVEADLGVLIRPKYGVLSFVADILRQFRGPVEAQKLSLSWLESADRPEVHSAGTFGYRRGRPWKGIPSESARLRRPRLAGRSADADARLP